MADVYPAGAVEREQLVTLGAQALSVSRPDLVAMPLVGFTLAESMRWSA